MGICAWRDLTELTTEAVGSEKTGCQFVFPENFEKPLSLECTPVGQGSRLPGGFGMQKGGS